MKRLLAFTVNAHDSSLAWFDGQRLRYHKLERSTQVKRAAITSVEQAQHLVKQLWSISFDDADCIGIMAEDNVFDINEGLLEKYHMQRIDHHYAHYLSGCMLTDQTPTVGIVIDGEGDEGNSWSVYRDDVLIRRGYSEHNGSVGCFLEQFGYHVGVSNSTPVLDVAGKLMGLQSYGEIMPGLLDRLSGFDIYCINDLENFMFNIEYGDYDPQEKRDIARTVHHWMEQQVLAFFKEYASSDEVIVYSGGVAQNVIFNSVLRKHFPNIIIPPHSTDDGLSLGIIEYLRRQQGLPKFDLSGFPYIMDDQSPMSAPSINTVKKAAAALANGKTLGWYQGHGEVGARALGNRSILMDPRIVNGKDIINAIKRREGYRPFGAVVLAEHADQYFNPGWSNPHMLYVSETRRPDLLPAITHVDDTCRVQTLNQENFWLRALLEEFMAITGCPVLLNTSLNLAGRPMAGCVDDARALLENSSLDVLVYGDTLLEKNYAYA